MTDLELRLLADDVDAANPWAGVAAKLAEAAAYDAVSVIDESGLWVVWDEETLGLACPAFAVTDGALGDALTALHAREPHAWTLIGTGRHVLGSLGSYLVARLTRGLWHAIDLAGAERSGLWAGTWQLPTSMDLRSTALPEVLDPLAAMTDPSVTGRPATPIAFG